MLSAVAGGALVVGAGAAHSLPYYVHSVVRPRSCHSAPHRLPLRKSCHNRLRVLCHWLYAAILLRNKGKILTKQQLCCPVLRCLSSALSSSPYPPPLLLASLYPLSFCTKSARHAAACTCSQLPQSRILHHFVAAAKALSQLSSGCYSRVRRSCLELYPPTGNNLSRTITAFLPCCLRRTSQKLLIWR